MWPKQTLQMFWMKTTSNGRWPQMEDYLKYKKWNISANTKKNKIGLMWPKKTLQMFQIKMNSNGRQTQLEDHLKYPKWNISATTGLIFPKILNLGLCDKSKLYKYFKWRQPIIEDDIQWKTTSNVKSEIPQQLLVQKWWVVVQLITLSNVPMKMTPNGRQIQLTKVNKFSNWLVLPQFQNWCLSDQTKYYKCFKWRLTTIDRSLKYQKGNKLTLGNTA
jgi:hypothetical protein